MRRSASTSRSMWRRRANCAPGEEILRLGRDPWRRVNLTDDPVAAVAGADAVITDCWVSMGDEEETERRNLLLEPYQVNERLMRRAGQERHLHALPAGASRRGGHGRRDRRAAIGRLRRGREPAARAKGHIDLVFRRARPVIERAGTTPKGAEKETPSRVVSFDTRNDRVLPFAVEAADMRGRLVRLGPAVDTILSHYDYPAPVARVLGEGVALAALLGSMLESQGRFQLQTRSDGAVDLLIVDYDTPGRLRGFLRYDLSRVDPASSTASLLGDGHMALTIERGEEGSRYQGVVTLDGEGFAHAAHEYFRQSEQIPSFIRLAVAEVVDPAGTQLARRRHRRCSFCRSRPSPKPRPIQTTLPILGTKAWRWRRP